MEDLDLKSKVVRFFREQFGPETELTGWKTRGKGTHGAASRLKISTPEREERLIMKTLYPSGLGHDYFSDRGGVLMLAGSNYNQMEKHVKAFDVVGESPDRLISLKDVQEFHIFMQRNVSMKMRHRLPTIRQYHQAKAC